MAYLEHSGARGRRLGRARAALEPPGSEPGWEEARQPLGPALSLRKGSKTLPGSIYVVLEVKLDLSWPILGSQSQAAFLPRGTPECAGLDWTSGIFCVSTSRGSWESFPVTECLLIAGKNTKKQ